MELRRHEEDEVGWDADCERCGQEISRYRGQDDVRCPNCGAIYNCFGNRLRDDVHERINWSEYDEDITDMDGYEAMMARYEHDG